MSYIYITYIYYIYVYMYTINLYTTVMSLFESPSAQLRSNADHVQVLADFLTFILKFFEAKLYFLSSTSE